MFSQEDTLTSDAFKRPLSKHTKAAEAFKTHLRGDADTYIYKLLTQRPGTDPQWEDYYGVETSLVYIQWILLQFNFRPARALIGNNEQNKAVALLQLAKETIEAFYPEVDLETLHTLVPAKAASLINRWRAKIQDCKNYFLFS